MDALERGLAQKIVVSVVNGDNKTHLLSRENAALLFQLALPPALRDRIIVEAVSSREAIEKYGVNARLKGARDKKDVDYEARNIGKAIDSAAQRGEAALPVIWIASSPEAAGEKIISSTRGRAALLKDVPDIKELLTVFPEQVVQLLIEANQKIPSEVDRGSDAFREAFNAILHGTLTKTQPITVQVQRREGHLYELSRVILNRIFAPQVFDPDGTKSMRLDLPEGTPIHLRVDRISDCITAVAQGVAEWGIVSDASLEGWRRSAEKVVVRQGGQSPAGNVKTAINLGFAGCKWMMLLPKEHEGQDWKKLLLEDRVTIITSSRSELAGFLKRRGIDIADVLDGQIIRHKGSTERFARDWMNRTKHKVLLFDTVATGNTAFKHGFIPQIEHGPQFKEDEHSVLLIGRANMHGYVQTDNLCVAVSSSRYTIHHDLVESYVGMLRDFREKTDNPKAQEFAERRITQIRAMAAEHAPSVT